MGLLESATAGPGGQLLGVWNMTVWGQQFLGWRFSLATASRVTRVGGHLCASAGASLGTSLFAAVIKLSSLTALPAFAPHMIPSSADTLAHILFLPPSPSSQLLIPLSAPLVLQPGTYGLVFGGADTAIAYTPFGATGTGVMPTNNQDLPDSTYFFGDQFRWNALAPSKLRFAVEFEAIGTGDTTPPIPPTGLRTS